MPRAKKNGRDGIFMRRGNYYISFNDQTDGACSAR